MEKKTEVKDRKRVAAYLTSRTRDRLDEMVAVTEKSRSAVICDAIEDYYRKGAKWR